jgi:hypothetical protein
MTNLLAGTYTTTVTDASSNSVNITNILTQPAALIILPPDANELKKQCDPNYHYIPFYISNSSIPAGPVAVEYSIDGGGWQPTGMTFVNQTTPLIITKAAGDINTNIRIRFSYVQGGNTCYSNTLNGTAGVSLSSIKTPTVALDVQNLSTSVGQCTPNSANVSVSIARDPARTPINVFYSINGGVTWISAGSTSANFYNFTVTGLPATQVNPNNVNILVKTIDNVGCEDTVAVNNFIVPSALLTCNVTTSGPITTPGPNFGKYTHVVTGSGGVGTYTGTGTFLDYNTTYTATITDSNGCSATATG